MVWCRDYRQGPNGHIRHRHHVTNPAPAAAFWDSLVVKIDPVANTTQFFFNGADLAYI
jgi:hypothetical protein